MMDTLTDVPGLQVGHAQVAGGGSGSTVVMGPFRGAVEVRGMATGTRELETLDPVHIVPRVDAVLLTGGSAWGLDAAGGVMERLEEEGRGFPTAPGTAVPIVPAAVIYDLEEGRPRPDRTTGRRAAESATGGPVSQGRVGAGAGATVGKLFGPGRASPGGVGSAALQAGDHPVGALAVVNAFGDVRKPGGLIAAGARRDDGSFADSATVLRTAEGAPGRQWPAAEGTNTTLAVVATDAPLSRTDLQRVARVAATGVPRRVDPAHTPFDGDIVFALSTAGDEAPLPPDQVLALGSTARDALEEAILRGVESGGPADGGRRA